MVLKAFINYFLSNFIVSQAVIIIVCYIRAYGVSQANVKPSIKHQCSKRLTINIF